MKIVDDIKVGDSVAVRTRRGLKYGTVYWTRENRGVTEYYVGTPIGPGYYRRVELTKFRRKPSRRRELKW